ncbi:MAG: VOC family protein [Thermoplasmata archaeon]|nr:VOC family protein [Thermoplasmata archaeon]
MGAQGVSGAAVERGPLADTRLSTILLFVQDFPRMLAFYRDTLGLGLIRASERFAGFRTPGGGGISLHAGATSSAAPGAMVVLEFEVKDIDATVARLKTLGVEVGPIRDEVFGRIAVFDDPEGHHLGLEQRRAR